MGGTDDIGKPEQRQIGWRRFGLEYVECGSGDMAASQSVIERLFVNESPASAIDHARAFFHQGDPLLVENGASLGSHRQMQSQEISLGEPFFEFAEELDLKRRGAGGRGIRM